MRTFRITAIVEAVDEADAEAVRDEIATAICPEALSESAGPDHRCPRGWFTILTELDADDAAEYADVLNR